jgi:hypothetical protein
VITEYVEGGFYWVRPVEWSTFTVGRWRHDHWEVVGSDEFFYEVHVLGPQIEWPS